MAQGAGGRRAHPAPGGIAPVVRDLRPAVEIAADKIQTLNEFWPLVEFLFDGPADDPAAFERVIAGDGGAETFAGGPRCPGRR